ncbi:MAG: bifunctional cobalt-precorrin-7 (C(5))-methyltransferase/cobalt-precorrin-6B (C(15))-methyltransferase [Mycobacteriales bacterium]
MIRVLGYDGSSLAAELLDGARLIVGGARHLAAVPVPAGARTLVMGDVSAAVTELMACDGLAVVVASGDPGWFGIVRALRAAGGDIEVHPAVSSVAMAFARIGIEWDDARVVSVHGRDPRRALAAVRAGGKIAVLTDRRTGPREIAAAAPVGTRVVVAERLGEPDERITDGTPDHIAARADWVDPNVVLVLNDQGPAAAPWQAGPTAHEGWALPEAHFEHRDGMVTKAEARAWALARLAPRSGMVFWDVGAGSGSVGIECARLGAAAVLVERDPDQLARAHRNALRHSVHVHLVAGEAPAALRPLPDPDGVFVGGGGSEVVRAVAGRRPQRVVVALAQLERVAEVRAALAAYDTEAILLQASRLEPLAEGTRLVPSNPVFLVCGVLP